MVWVFKVSISFEDWDEDREWRNEKCCLIISFKQFLLPNFNSIFLQIGTIWCVFINFNAYSRQFWNTRSSLFDNCIMWCITSRGEDFLIFQNIWVSYIAVIGFNLTHNLFHLCSNWYIVVFEIIDSKVLYYLLLI